MKQPAPFFRGNPALAGTGGKRFLLPKPCHLERAPIAIGAIGTRFTARFASEASLLRQRGERGEPAWPARLARWGSLWQPVLQLLTQTCHW